MTPGTPPEEKKKSYPPIKTPSHENVIKNSWVYLTTRAFLRWFYGYVGRAQFINTQVFPETGPVILAPNHTSFLDPPLVGTPFKRFTWFMAKEELFHPPLAGRYMFYCRSFPVRRGTADRAALRRALELLEMGECVMIFPEGERSKDGKLKPPELGISMIALKSRAPVIPVAIEGSREILPAGSKRIKRGHLKVTYGNPVDLSDLYGQRETRDTLQECADRIMAAIAGLLNVPPPK